jgi:hypothetical protein
MNDEKSARIRIWRAATPVGTDAIKSREGSPLSEGSARSPLTSSPGSRDPEQYVVVGKDHVSPSDYAQRLAAIELEQSGTGHGAFQQQKKQQLPPVAAVGIIHAVARAEVTVFCLGLSRPVLALQSVPSPPNIPIYGHMSESCASPPVRPIPTPFPPQARSRNERKLEAKRAVQEREAEVPAPCRSLAWHVRASLTEACGVAGGASLHNPLTVLMPRGRRPRLFGRLGIE